MRNNLCIISVLGLLGCVTENKYEDTHFVYGKDVSCTEVTNNPDGIMSCESICEGLPITGKIVRYYSRKKVRSEWFVIDGKAEGLVTKYDTNGNVEQKFNLIGGKLNGLATFYYQNGQIKEERYNKNGIKHGPYKFYYENGQLMEEGTYTNDKINGKVKFYNSNGSFAYEITYDMGRLLPNSIPNLDETNIKDEEIRLFYRNQRRHVREVCLSSINICSSYTCSNCDKCKMNLNTWQVLTIEQNGVLLVNFAKNPLPIFLYTKKKYLSGEEIKTDNYFERAGIYEYKAEIFDETIRVPAFRETTIPICK